MLTILDKPIKHLLDDLRYDIERVGDLAEDGYMEEIAPTVIEKLNEIISLITDKCGQKIGNGGTK